MFLAKAYPTLLVVVLVFALAVDASASGGVARRHDLHHQNLKRIVKKRAPQQTNSFPIPVIGAGANPTETTASTEATAETTTATDTTTGLPTDTTGVSAVSSVDPSSAISSGSSSAQSLSASSLVPSSSVPVSSSSALPSSTSSSSSASIVAQTSQPPETTDSPTPTASSQKSTNTVVVTESAEVTSSAGANDNTANVSQSGATNTETPKTTVITVIVVIVAVIAGVAIVWTLFRKWKLGRSSKFDERMQPIDWQPTLDDGGIPGAHRRRASDTSSFRSGFNGSSEHGHGSARGYGATSDAGHGAGLGPLPDHDFTAASSHLAPVGGYADLARGPSPQPQMSQTLNRGPSMTRGDYNDGLPLHAGGRY